MTFPQKLWITLCVSIRYLAASIENTKVFTNWVICNQIDQAFIYQYVTLFLMFFSLIFLKSVSIFYTLTFDVYKLLPLI